ncbi:hypothetical protein M0804_006157 [Polistes exclamans]|nr:hypothetical protein M0804_006157 [Polistes exclamans]
MWSKEKKKKKKKKPYFHGAIVSWKLNIGFPEIDEPSETSGRKRDAMKPRGKSNGSGACFKNGLVLVVGIV